MPAMWEYVLRADAEHDLANPVNGEKWFNSQKSWHAMRQNAGASPETIAARYAGAGFIPWPDSVRVQWESGLRTFRHYAAQFKGAKGRKPGISAEAASDVLNDAVRSLVLEVDDHGRATLWAGMRVAGENTLQMTVEKFLAISVMVFFQELFASMLILEPRNEPICGRCGKPLERTKAGKPSKAEHCGACKFAVWNETNRTEEERKNRWKQDQKEHREKVKREKHSTKKGK